jgi:hypothetical protein
MRNHRAEKTTPLQAPRSAGLGYDNMKTAGPVACSEGSDSGYASHPPAHSQSLSRKTPSPPLVI